MSDIETKLHGRTDRKLKTLDELENGDCRWPFGDPQQGPFGFCGAPRAGTGPYCQTHHEMARVPRQSGVAGRRSGVIAA